jgi:cation diffusion facilitator CzcD-associated flavoprotein CzcO
MLDVKKDLAFSSCIVGAGFDLLAGKWNSKAEDGRTMRSRFLIIAKDFAAKRHFHDWKGLNPFNGVIHHTSVWHNENIDVSGKLAAVVGTGLTGAQIAQEMAKEAATLAVF